MIGNLGITINADKTSLNKATKEVKDAFDKAGGEVEKGLNKSITGGLKVFASTQIINGLNKVSGWALLLAGNLQQADVAFTTMLGSVEASKKMLKELSDFAAKTPFELTGIRQTAKQLLAYGIAAEDIIPALKALGDVSAGLSVPIEQVAYAYGQVKSAGRLLGQDLRQFTNAGVPLIQELAKNLGVAESSIKSMVSAGTIGFEDVKKAFETMSSEGGRFANLMDKQSNTLIGAWSNFKDAMNSLGESLGGLFVDSLTSIIKSITPLIDKIKEFITEHPALAKAISTVVVAFGSFIAIAGVVSGAIGLLTPLFVGTAGVITAVIGGVSLLTGGFVGLSYAMKNHGLELDKNIKTHGDLKKALDNNEKAQNDLNKKLKEGKIYGMEYWKELEKLKKENELLKNSSDKVVYSIEDIDQALKLLEDGDFTMEATITELQRIKSEAENSKNALNSLLATKEILNEKLEKERKETETGVRSLAGGGSVLSTITMGEIANVDLGNISAERQIEEYASRIESITQKLNNLTGGTTSTTGGVSSSVDKMIKDTAESYKDGFDEINDSFEKSQDVVDDYKKKIQSIGDEFENIAQTAEDELFSVNQSLSQLDSDYMQSQGDRYVELIKQIDEIKSQGEITMDNYQELAKLEEERQFLLGVTTEEVRKQALEYSELSESQKTAKKYEEEKLSLLERQAILTAISKQAISTDEDGNTILDQKVRINELNEYEYLSEAGKRTAITDAKNIEYARDIVNQQTKMQNEIILSQQKIDAEIELQTELNNKKISLEEAFTKFIDKQTAKQKESIDSLIDDINEAIKKINEMNALNAKSSSSVSTDGFMEGGYTGDGPTNGVAGDVHYKEYVLNNDMLQKLPGIIPALENIRNGGNIDNSRSVSMSGITVQNQVDLELLLDRIRFKHL